MPKQPPHLVGDRVVVRMARPDDAAAIVRYYTENQTHLARFESPKPRPFLTNEFWEKEAIRRRQAFERDTACRVFVFDEDGALTGSAGAVIGHVGLSAFIRGSFHAAFLGYSLAGDLQGRGLMTEALRLVIDYAFGELNLHRLMANYDPENEKSGRVLERLGFTREGYARDYLFINGAWRDHVMTSLVSTTWRAPQGYLVRTEDGEVVYVPSPADA